MIIRALLALPKRKLRLFEFEREMCSPVSDNSSRGQDEIKGIANKPRFRGAQMSSHTRLVRFKPWRGTRDQ